MATTQLNIATAVNMEALSILAREFKQHFVRSSELMEEGLTGRRFIFNRDGSDTYPFGEWEDGVEGQVYPIEPVNEGVTIASTDSSCVLLGETSDGSVYAVRAAVCFASHGRMQGYFRVGPIVIYLSPKGAFGLPGTLEGYELRVALSDHTIAERVIRNSMEKRIIASLLDFEQRMVVVADGSLKHPLDTYPESLLRPEMSGSSLVGFSKSSSLISSSHLSGGVSRAPGASFTPLEEGPIHTLLAKFSNDGLVFRLDVARTPGPVRDVLGTMLSNDAFYAGYPESLRIAHHLSVFSKSEDTALKAYITKRYSLRRLSSFGLRRIALGGLSNSG